MVEFHQTLQLLLVALWHAVFVVLAAVSALLIVVLVIFFWRRSAKAALLVNKYEHQEMTERKKGSKNIIVARITLFSSQFFQM